MKYYSGIKESEIMPFAVTWVQLEIIEVSEVRQRKTNIIRYYLYEESKKMIHRNLLTKQKQSHRQEKTQGYQRGMVRRRDKSGSWD